MALSHQVETEGNTRTLRLFWSDPVEVAAFKIEKDQGAWTKWLDAQVLNIQDEYRTRGESPPSETEIKNWFK